MDVNLLKRFDLAQDVDSLYKEILRNCRYRAWYCHTVHYKQIDHLVIEEQFDCLHARTNDDHWMVEKWINPT